MEKGVTTSLQKEYTQFQKDLEKMDARLDEKLEKLGNKLRNELFTELKQAMEHFNAEIAAIKQLIPGLATAKTKPKSSAIVEMDSSEEVHQLLGNTLDLDTPPVAKGPLNTELDNQFVKLVGILEEDKVQPVMIHLDGKALQGRQRFMRTNGPMKEMKWTAYVAGRRARFYDNDFVDPMSDLVSVKQTSTVEKFYKEIEVNSKTLIVDVFEKLDGVYSLVFVDKLVDVNDPFCFRLLVMGKRNHCIFREKNMDLMEWSQPVNLLRRHEDGSFSHAIINVIRRATDAAIHCEAVGVIGNLVHSSPNLKRGLVVGTLQPVIGLLTSCISGSQREATLLLGQLAATDSDYKVHIMQMGAESTKNVLIFMSDTGGGHIASAEVIHDGFQIKLGDEYRIFVQDVWKEFTGWPLNNRGRSYKFTGKHVQLWKVAFHSTSHIWIHSSYLAAIVTYYAKEIETCLMEYKPDTIINGHLQHNSLGVLKWKGLQKKVIFVIEIADLNTCHPTLFQPGVNRCYWSSKEVAKRELSDGLEEFQIQVFGLGTIAEDLIRGLPIVLNVYILFTSTNTLEQECKSDILREWSILPGAIHGVSTIGGSTTAWSITKVDLQISILEDKDVLKEGVLLYARIKGERKYRISS